MRQYSILRLAAGAALWAAAPALAAPVISGAGLDAPAQAIGFEGARARPGALVLGLDRAGIGFSRALTLSPQAVDHVAGMSGVSLGNHGDRGWDGALSLRFRDVMTAFAFAFATESAHTRLTALLDGRVVESFAVATAWDQPETAFLGFRGIEFDEILLRTDAALILIDNLQIGEAGRAPRAALSSAALTRDPPAGPLAAAPVPPAFGLLALGFAALGVVRLLRAPRQRG